MPGLALVKAPNDLCCTGDGGGSGGEESSYIEDELTHAGDGVGGLMFDFMDAVGGAVRPPPRNVYRGASALRT